MSVYPITLAVLSYIAYWKLFEKAGEKGWKALIPYYNTYITAKLADCVALFVVQLILGIIVQLVVVGLYIKFVIWSILLAANEGNAQSSDEIFDFVGPFFGIQVGLMMFAVIAIVIAVIALIAINIVIRIKFVRCYSDEQVFPILAGVGSIPSLNVLFVVAITILGLEQKYTYQKPISMR